MSKRADRRHLLEVAYATDAGLSARAALYDHQVPHWDLPSAALDVLGDVEGCTVLDVGCGNGRYLGPLRHAGARVIGCDLSAGMLAAVAPPHPPLVVADAVSLPVADASADVVLLPHMLYHVPEPAEALAEVRSALRPGGRVLVVVNGPDHLREMNELWLPLVERAGIRTDIEDTGLLNPRLRGPEATALVEAWFADVTVRTLAAEAVVTDPEPVVRHAASTTGAHVVGPELVDTFRETVAERIARDGELRITTEVVMVLGRRR